MKYQGDKTDVSALIAYAQSLEFENEKLRQQLKTVVAALKTIDDIAVSHTKGGIGKAQVIVRQVLTTSPGPEQTR